MVFRLSIPRISVFAVVLAAAGHAQPEPARQSYSRMINIDALIDNHARFLARRYNLSPEQDQYTQAFLRQKADNFLSRHREELYDLIDQLVAVRTGGTMEPQELIAWGQRALPLYEEAKALIIQGNEEWRGILSDEQKKVHDEDVKEMYTSFGQTDDQLARIVNGQMSIDEFRKGPAGRAPLPNAPGARQPNPNPVAQPMPESPAARPDGVNPPPPGRGVRVDPPSGTGGVTQAGGPGGTHTGSPARPGRTGRGTATSAPAGANFESEWERYVREFIEKYKLDDAQQERARAVLKDCQEQAQHVMRRRKSELDRLDEKIKGLTGNNEAAKIKELGELNQQRTKLLEPISDIEKQLKAKLEKLPTRAQRQAAEQAGQAAPARPGEQPGRPRVQRPPPQPQPQPVPQPPQPRPEPEEKSGGEEPTEDPDT